MGAQDGGLADGLALLALVLGEFDDEDAVLGGERERGLGGKRRPTGSARPYAAAFSATPIAPR